MTHDELRATAMDYLDTTADTVRRVQAECLDDIAAAAEILIASLRGGGKLLICGNGGSAADAQHLATEFVSTLTIDNPRPSIPAIALTTDSSLLTAIANDFGIEGIFARQVESLGRAGRRADRDLDERELGQRREGRRAGEIAGRAGGRAHRRRRAVRSRPWPTPRSACRRP